MGNTFIFYLHEKGSNICYRLRSNMCIEKGVEPNEGLLYRPGFQRLYKHTTGYNGLTKGVFNMSKVSVVVTPAESNWCGRRRSP